MDQPICEAPGCANGRSRRKRYCSMHIKRLARHGDLDTVLTNHKERPGYRALHDRLRNWRGPARNFACVKCGARASDWAYDHTDDEAVLDEKGRLYSYDIDRYIPLCHPCHTKWDQQVTPARFPNVNKIWCKNGHEMTIENTRVDKRGYRRCRACNRERVKRIYQAKKQKQR